MPQRKRREALARALAGLRVVLPRSPDRAAGMVAELQRHGAVPVLLPLIDFEQPASTKDLDESLKMLGEGHFAWVIITSVTTVRALKQRAEAAGATLHGLLREPTKVAAVGESSKRALEAEGITVHFVPAGQQSSAGLLEDWPVPDESVPGTAAQTCLLPQADLADASLYEGLMDRGWQVLPVTAYRTVDYPADPARRLTAVLASAGPAPRPPAARSSAARHSAAHRDPQEGTAGVEVLSLGQFRAAAAGDGVDAVVLTSPSIARRLADGLADAGTAPGPMLAEPVLLIAIGATTAAEARALGLRIDATAEAPTPEGIADALAAAVVQSTYPSPAERA